MGWLGSLLGLFDKLMGYFRDKQLLDAGRAQEKVEAVEEIERRVEQAKDAVSIPDPERDERLRKRFGRRGGQ